MLEAMAASKPIIATNIGSQKEVAAHADIARLVEPADARALADAIVRMGTDPELMARLGTNARGVYERHYTEHTMLQTYRQLYFDLLRAKCPQRAHTAVPAQGSRPAEPATPVDQNYPELVSTPPQKGGVL
jgi:hypothetical protein